MIQTILDLLPYAKGETENIRIAQGKYKIPQTWREGYKQIKQEVWQKRST